MSITPDSLQVQQSWIYHIMYSKLAYFLTRCTSNFFYEVYSQQLERLPCTLIFVFLDPAAVASQKAQQQQQTQTQQASQQQGTQPSGQQQGTEAAGSIKATEPMWRCSRIMHMQKELHPTVLASLEGIVDQVS